MLQPPGTFNSPDNNTLCPSCVPIFIQDKVYTLGNFNLDGANCRLQVTGCRSGFHLNVEGVG